MKKTFPIITFIAIIISINNAVIVSIIINAMNNVIRIVVVGEIRRTVISFMKKAIIFIITIVINNVNVIMITIT